MRITEFHILKEIKDEYINLRRELHSRHETVKRLKAMYHSEISSGCDDDALLFWIGLADAQYASRELEEDVAQKALCALDIIVKKDWNICSGDVTRRRDHYLMAPLPERKIFGKAKKYRCPWEIGDTFAYELVGEPAQRCELEGYCVLLRKVDELETWDGHLCPVVTLTMWQKSVFPANSADYSSVPIMILNKRQFICPAGTYEYRTQLLVSSAQKLKKLNLVFIGNFPGVDMPSDEFIIREPGFITMTPLNRFTWECCTYWKKHCFWIKEKENENVKK